MAKVIGKWRWNDDVHESIWTVTVPKYTQNVNFITSRYSAPFVCESIYFATSSDAIQILYSGAYENKSFAAMILYSDGREPLIVEEMLTMDFGDTEQEVSDDFYNVLVTCATPVTSIIAAKLVLLRNNQPRVYHAGYDKGLIDGKQAEYDTIWNAIQDNGKRTNYYGAFAYSNYPLGVFKPKYPLKPAGANRMFVATTVELPDGEYLEVDLSTCTDVYWMFRNSKIKRIGKCDLTAVTAAMTGVFSLMSRTVEIKEIVSKESLTFSADAFNQSTALERVIFSGVIGSALDIHWSAKLSRASIVSIITHLSDTASGNTVTLSKTAVDKACAEAELSDRINSTNSAWWAWLIGTKPNWTISLV